MRLGEGCACVLWVEECTAKGLGSLGVKQQGQSVAERSAVAESKVAALPQR